MTLSTSPCGIVASVDLALPTSALTSSRSAAWSNGRSSSTTTSAAGDVAIVSCGGAKQLCPIGTRGGGKRRVNALEQIGEVGTGERKRCQLSAHGRRPAAVPEACAPSARGNPGVLDTGVEIRERPIARGIEGDPRGDGFGAEPRARGQTRLRRASGSRSSRRVASGSDAEARMSREPTRRCSRARSSAAPREAPTMSTRVPGAQARITSRAHDRRSAADADTQTRKAPMSDPGAK